MTRSFGLTNKSESWKHWLAKVVAYKVLADRGHEVYMERDTGEGFLDVFDRTDRVGVEMESRISEKSVRSKLSKYLLDASVRDVFFIDLRKLPDDFEGMREAFEVKL